MIKKISLIIMLLAINICTFAKGVINVAVLYSQNNKEEMKRSQDIIEKEFVDVLDGNYSVVFPKELQVIAKEGTEGIDKSYSDLVKNKKVDVIVGGDHLVSNQIIAKKNIKKLSIMPFAQYISHGETSQINNLTYSIQDVGFDKIFQLLRSVDEEFTEITIIAPNRDIKSN